MRYAIALVIALLCVSGWPEARLGLLVNVVLLLVLLVPRAASRFVVKGRPPVWSR